MPLFKHNEFVALADVGDGAEAYFASIESSARRNVRKARRLGYQCRRISIAEHVEAVPEILASSEVRQGPMPAQLLNKDPSDLNDPPPSNSAIHDHPYFGVFRNDRMVAYSSCLLAGELYGIESIYGHADFQHDGVVPLLIVATSEYLEARHPAVRYYAYGSFFSAGPSMQRFKKKFDFYPHRVDWQQG